MKKQIIKISILATLVALLAFFISSLFLIDYTTKTIAEDSVKKLTAVYVQNLKSFDFDKALIVPDVLDKDTRITVLDDDGKKVLFDNMFDINTLQDHSSREEIVSAKNGAPKISIRYSETLGKKMIYYAEACTANNDSNIIVRVAIPLATVTAFMTTSVIMLALVIVVVIILVNLLSGKLAKTVLEPIKSIGANIKEINGGNYKKLPLSKFKEIDQVIAGINEISESLSISVNSIQNEKNRLYFVLDSMQEGIVAIDKNNEIVLINRYARGLFNVDSKILSKELSYLTENRQILDNFNFGSIDKVFKTEEKERIYLSRISKLRDSSLTILIFSDITEEEELNKLKKSFFESASHELKTPITSIKGFTELLDQDVNISANSKKYLQIMSNDIDRLLAIIDDMFSLTKLENNDVENAIESIDLKSICAEVAEHYLAQAKLKGIEIIVTGSDKIFFNKEQLFELIGNLVDNAIKYNKDNGKIEITIKNKTLTVKDNGIGIEQRHLSRIFERFYRVEKGRSRKAGGTGLGLAIVKHIAINYNAEVSVKSIVGIGTEFIIKFKDINLR